jgi:hypothetical protein
VDPDSGTIVWPGGLDVAPDRLYSEVARSADEAMTSGRTEQVELIHDIRDARAELARGEGIPHGEVVAELRSRLTR